MRVFANNGAIHDVLNVLQYKIGGLFLPFRIDFETGFFCVFFSVFVLFCISFVTHPVT